MADSYVTALGKLKAVLLAGRLKDENTAAVVADDKKLSRVILLIETVFLS